MYRIFGSEMSPYSVKVTGPETFEFDLEDGVLSGELVTGDGRRTMTGLTFRDGTLTWTVPSRLADAEPMSPRQQALIGAVFYYEATFHDDYLRGFRPGYIGAAELIRVKAGANVAVPQVTQPDQNEAAPKKRDRPLG